MDLSRTAYGYQTHREDDTTLRNRLRELAGQRKRFGSPRLHIMLKRENEQLNASCAELMLAESRLGAKFGIIYSESATLKTMRGIQNYITAAGPGIVFNLSTK